MKNMRKLIEAEMDKCLVTEQEWASMLQNRMTQQVDNDPFKQGVFPEDQGN
jgi:hypothetical protein